MVREHVSGLVMIDIMDVSIIEPDWANIVANALESKCPSFRSSSPASWQTGLSTEPFRFEVEQCAVIYV